MIEVLACSGSNTGGRLKYPYSSWLGEYSQGDRPERTDGSGCRDCCHGAAANPFADSLTEGPVHQVKSECNVYKGPENRRKARNA
jgi:hypothetical protein